MHHLTLQCQSLDERIKRIQEVARQTVEQGIDREAKFESNNTEVVVCRKHFQQSSSPSRYRSGLSQALLENFRKFGCYCRERSCSDGLYSTKIQNRRLN